MATRHSFAPKLTDYEAEVLQQHSLTEFTTDLSAGAARLKVRGLLESKDWRGGDYRLTTRGALMLQRRARAIRILKLKAEFPGRPYRELAR